MRERIFIDLNLTLHYVFLHGISYKIPLPLAETSLKGQNIFPLSLSWFYDN